MDNTKQVVVFTVGNEEYAIPIDHVLLIEKVEGVTPIPHLPNYVRGIMRIRDELIPVLDTGKILYDQNLAMDDTVRIIVLKTEEMSLGILVQDAKEILHIPKDTIKQVGLVAYQKTSYFTGVANLENRLVTLISPSILVKSLDGIREIQEYMTSQLQK